MNSLTGNFCSQIERLFTFAQMLAATGQSPQQAQADWEQLLTEGRLVEVKGCDVPYYRYKPLQKPKAVSRNRAKGTPKLVRSEQMVADMVRDNPGLNALKLSRLPQCQHNYSTLLRAVNRLLKSGILAKVRGGLYLAENVDAELAKNNVVELKSEVRERLEIMWNAIIQAGQFKAATLVEQTGLSPRTVLRYLSALKAEGYISRSWHKYQVQKITAELPNIKQLRTYQ